MNRFQLILALADITDPATVQHDHGLNLFQLIFTTLCGIMALRAMARVWRRQVPLRSGSIATLLWAAAAVTIAVPQSTIYVANRLGIGQGLDLVVYFAILGGLAAGTYFYQRCRHLENLITELVRRDAVTHATQGPRED